MPPEARIADTHTSPIVDPASFVPHAGGTVLPPRCPTVKIGSMPGARVGDTCGMESG